LVKTRKIECAGFEARGGDIKHGYIILKWKFEGK
jgi:hypothetical protein